MPKPEKSTSGGKTVLEESNIYADESTQTDFDSDPFIELSELKRLSEKAKMSNFKFDKSDRLTGENYRIWSERIEGALVLNDLWLDIEKQKEAPNAEADKAKKAYYFICQTIDGSHVEFLKDVARYDSVIALRALKSRYEGEGVMPKMDILKRVLQLRFDGDGDIKAHIDDVRSSYQRLTEKGLDLPDIVRVTNLLISLPHDFSNLVSHLITMNEKDLTFRVAESAIQNESRRLTMRNEGVAASSSKFVPKSFNQKKDTNKSCSFCGKRGHVFDSCFKRQRKHSFAQKPQSSQQPKNKSASNYSAVDDVHNDDSSDVQASHSAKAYIRAFTATVERNDDGKPSIFARLDDNSTQRSIAHRSKSCHSFATPNKHANNEFKSNHTLIPTSPRRKMSGVPVNSSYLIEEVLDVPRTPGRDIGLYEDPSETSKYNFLSEVSIDIELNEDENELMNKLMEDYQKSFHSTSNFSNISGWIVDSGASMHMTHDANLFLNLTMCDFGRIKIADGSFIPIKGIGRVKILIKTFGEPFALMLHNVAYVPNLHINLLSVNELDKSGHAVHFENGTAKLKVKDSLIAFAKFIDNNYLVIEEQCNSTYTCLHEWHRRLAHRNLREIKDMRNLGLEIAKCNCSDQCDACCKGKSVSLPFNDAKKPENPLDLIVSDVAQIETQSLSGCRYFLTIVDACTDYTMVRFLRHKSEAAQQIMNFIEFTKTQLSAKPKIFRSDGGGEFINDVLKNYLNTEGIKIETTVRNTPQQNGIAERKNRTLNDATRTLLIASELPKSLWAEAMNNVVYTQNRIVRRHKLYSPIELFTGRKANSTFMEFGRHVYVTTQKQQRGKLDPRAAVMRFLSVDDNVKGFRLWTGNKVIIERNVKPKLNIEVEYREPLSRTHIDPLVIDASSDAEEFCTELNNPRRSERLALKNVDPQAHTSVKPSQEPHTYKEAISCIEKDEWIKAMDEEMNALKHTGTYELSDLPSNKKAIGCKWVFKKKPESGGIRFKARLVAKGFSQKYGEDYDEVFAPVARAPTIRLLLSMAGKLKLHVRQFDVKTAFLNGTLEENIYMKLPPGFDQSSQVMHLRKSLYGLKQAARTWNQLLTKSLESVGFTQSKVDECLYVLKQNGHTCFIVVHVDDMLAASSSLDMITSIAKQLSTNFELKDLGAVKQFLGIDIHMSKDGFYAINQESYITNIAEELQVLNVKPHKYPLDPGYFKIECEEFLEDNSEYRKIIGKLLYLSANTRPDISASVCILAKRVQKPRKVDMGEALRVVKYLVTTKNHLLHLNNSNMDTSLIAYTDANFGECKLDAKSNSGVICFINGAPIIWSSKKQSLVALSTCEAEYYAIVESVKEVIWLRNLLEIFDSSPDVSTTILNDNQSTLNMIKNDEYAPRTKYFGVRYHFIRDHIKLGTINLYYVPTEFNIADMLTKPLCGPKLKTLRVSAGLVSPSESSFIEPQFK